MWWHLQAPELEQGGVKGDFGQQTAELAHLQAKTMGLTFRSGAGVLSLLAALVATGVSLPMAVIAGAVSALFLYSSASGLRQTALKPGQPVLAGYHPVPEELGLNKERAAIFQKHWNRYVSRGEIVYLKSSEGQEILERFGLADPLGVRKHLAAIWR